MFSFFASPLFWLMLLIIAIVGAILVSLYEKYVLKPRWLADRTRPSKERLQLYDFYTTPRLVWIGYCSALVIGCTSLVVMLYCLAHNYAFNKHEIELKVKVPTTTATDGSTYVVLNYGYGFTYVCGETDQCQGLEVGDTIIYTKYIDDTGAVHRQNLHRK